MNKLILFFTALLLYPQNNSIGAELTDDKIHTRPGEWVRLKKIPEGYTSSWTAVDVSRKKICGIVVKEDQPGSIQEILAGVSFIKENHEFLYTAKIAVYPPNHRVKEWMQDTTDFGFVYRVTRIPGNIFFEKCGMMINIPQEAGKIIREAFKIPTV